MRSSAVIAVALVALTAGIAVLPTTQAAIWSIDADPGFAFNGDNVTVEVSGLSDMPVMLRVEGANNTTLADGSVTTDDVGYANWTFSVPYDVEQGNYTVTAIVSQERVANETVEIVYDEMVYQRHLVEELNEKVDDYQDRVIRSSRETQEVKERLGVFLWVTGGCLIGAMWAIFFTAVNLKDVKEYSWGRRERQPVTDWMYRLIHPRPPGIQGDYVRGVEEKRKRGKKIAQEGREGIVVMRPTLMYPSKDSPLGMKSEYLDTPDPDTLRDDVREVVRVQLERWLDERKEERKRGSIMSKLSRLRGDGT